MLGVLSYTTKGALQSVDQPLSAYQPSQSVQDLTKKVKEAYQLGEETLTRPFQEFNGLSLIGRMNEDQQAWLSHSPKLFNDPESSWRWQGVRPITRNKIISTAAHLTSQLITPQVFAQNEKDEEDKEAAYVMRDLLEYNIQRSDYEQAFLYAVISGLVNPVSYFDVAYCEAYQTVLEGTNSKHTRKEVIDDVLSGFQYNLVPADEMLIENPYTFDIQKQGFLIRKRLISFSEAEGLYGKHANFVHVRPGVRAFYNGENGLFYDVEDVNGTLVEEVRYMNRRGDCEVIFVNGIYLSNENAAYNPMKHRTNKNKPKYQYAKFGAEPIDAMRFWAYKSLVSKMSNDQKLVDKQWQMAVDGSFLKTFTPIISFGAGKLSKDVVVPGTVTDLDVNAKIQPLTVGDPMAAFNVMHEAERSLSESSQDSQMQGKEGGLPQTARQSILIQQNAETNLGVMGRMIGVMVKDVGELMLDDVMRYQTVGEIGEIIGGVPKMNYKTFIVHNRIHDGKGMTDYIKFTDRFAGQEFTEDEKRQEEMRMYQEAGDDKHIWEVNPALFSRMSYLVSVDYEQMLKKNTAFERAFKLETYDRAIANPFVDQRAVTRDFLLEPLMGGDASKYLAQEDPMGAAMPPGVAPGAQGRLPAQLMRSTAMEGLSA